MNLTHKKIYPAVDCFKFICCLLVIAIHAEPFVQNFWLNGGVSMMTRIAVPYFFTASGFFIFNTIRENKNIKADLIKYEVRLIKLYAVWYIIQNLISCIIAGSSNSITYYVRNFIWPNNGIALWFIPAAIYAVPIVFLLSRVLKPRAVLAVSLVIWSVGYCMSILQPLLSAVPFFDEVTKIALDTIGVQNNMFFGLPYVAMANLFASQRIEKNIKRDVIGIIVSFVGLGAELMVMGLIIHPTYTAFSFFTILLTYFVFHLTLTIEVKQRSAYYIMRKISTLVYVIHPVILKVISFVFAEIGFYDHYNLTLFFSVSIVSVLLSMSMHELSKKRAFKFLKILM